MNNCVIFLGVYQRELTLFEHVSRAAIFLWQKESIGSVIQRLQSKVQAQQLTHSRQWAGL